MSLSVAVLTLAGCATSTPEPAAVPDAAPPTSSAASGAASAQADPAPSSSSPAAEDPAALVARADSLYGTYVTRSGSSYQSRSLWAVTCDHFECTPVVLVLTADGSPTQYQVGSYERLQQGIWRPKPPGAPDPGGCAPSVDVVIVCAAADGSLVRTEDQGRTWDAVAGRFDESLMWGPVVSLAVGVQAVVGGGDGATLFPFEQVARLSSAGDVVSYDVEQPEGVMGYSSGDVVLTDGRVLTLLADWSDDRGRPSSRHHGLWVSAGDDWASYTPVEPVFSPPLTAPPRAGDAALRVLSASVDPDPVIWIQTWDDKVYVSTDDAATFRELPIR